jgi:two-component system sensor histidine kinase EvgS
LWNGTKHFQVINRDITDQKKLTQALIAAKEKAEESDRLKTAFLHNISHEVRTPLNSIVGFSELMSTPNLAPGKLKLFSTLISDSSNKLIQIITDTIEISQVQSNQVYTRYSEVDIINLFNGIVNKHSKNAKEKKLDFIFKVNPLTNEFIVQTDKEKVEKIFSHLIDNAIKFTLQGSVEIYCEIEEEKFNVTITDTGIGISDEMQKTIFEPFRQVEPDESRILIGNGLGLPLAKAYTTLLNGTLTLNSSLDKGTTIYFSIPRAKTNLMEEQRVITPISQTIRTILIAEDEYSNFLYLIEVLSDKTFTILHAENGQQAIDLCKSNKDVDLILMDIKMPIVDGYQAALEIKKLRPNLPIIAQTAYALDSEKQLFLGVFDDYITKPIKSVELKSKLLKYVDNKRS